MFACAYKQGRRQTPRRDVRMDLQAHCAPAGRAPAPTVRHGPSKAVLGHNVKLPIIANAWRSRGSKGLTGKSPPPRRWSGPVTRPTYQESSCRVRVWPAGRLTPAQCTPVERAIQEALSERLQLQHQP
ncbi:hypothetical protein GJAV_G00032310 [Gymnothorax javanicus]|nr:hypothetical protein GJAV_G00032310 [Gymnothorax javanicus]